MNDTTLKECIDMLTHLRDTYLKNHQTEKAAITAVIDMAALAMKEPATAPEPALKTKPKKQKA